MTCCCDERFRRSVLQNIYVYALWFIIILHIGTCLILDAIRHHETDKNNVSISEYVIISLLLSIEWILCIFSTRLLLKYLFLADIKPIVCLYVCKLIACSTIYLLLFKMDSSQFVYPTNLLQHDKTSYFELALTFFNYSASEQTCTGISDVVPIGVASELFSGAQILLFGITYNVFILSVAILRFSEGSDYEIKRYQNNNNDDIHDDHDHDTKYQSLLRAHSSNYNFFQINEQISASMDILNIEQHPVNEKYRKYFEFFYDYMLFICIGIELINSIIVYFICGTSEQCDASILIISIILDLIILFGCLLCIIIKLKMIKIIGMNINSPFINLIYAYLTALILFTFLYFDLWLLTKRQKIKPAFKINYDITNYWKMMEHFLYFSITSFTEHGSESIILTWSGYAQFLNGIQMLIGVFFISVVFGIGLMSMDIQRTIATEQYINEHISYSTPSNPSLFKAGLLTQKVSKMLNIAKLQNAIPNNVDLAGADLNH